LVAVALTFGDQGQHERLGVAVQHFAVEVFHIGDDISPGDICPQARIPRRVRR
jgi:hypothetical protein